MKKTLQILFIFLLTLVQGAMVKGQNPDIKRTMHWYFGYGAGLDFSKGYPEVDTTGVTHAVEATFAMSDTCGNLLFYGQDDSIFNKYHQLMDNGVIIAGPNLAQLIAIPQPGNDSIYYVFYSKVFQLYSKFKYAIINMNANNGLGKVIAKEIALIDTAATELVDITRHCNGTDFWISSKQSDCTNGRYIYSWLLTSNGINPVPVVSDIATIYQQNPYWNQNASGYLKFSPSGNIAAVDYLYENLNYASDSSYVELYHFDNCTGIFSDPITISYPFPFSLAFSPDNSKLYVGSTIGGGVSDTCYFSQFDILSYNQTDIINSKTILAQGILVGTSNRLAMDGKIYVADLDTNLVNAGLNRIGVIHNPNAPGLSCNYVPEEIDLLGKMHQDGFVCFTESYFSSFDYTPCATSGNNNIIVNSYNIYPNPFYDKLNIAIGDENMYVKIVIYDVLGHIVFDNIIKNNSQVNLSNLSKGIYILKVFNANNENLICILKSAKSY